ncbi:MAG: AbrB/MazE/SpoVT family DNA-binding domain-containing protein [Halobacteria archaeon]
MAIGKIDERGRVLIPEPLREQAGLLPGRRVRIRTRDGGVSIEPVPGADPFLALLRSPVRGGWRDPEPLEEEQWSPRGSSRTRAR